MFQISYFDLDRSLGNFYESTIREKCEFLRDAVIDNSMRLDSFFFVNDLKLNLKKQKEKILVGVLSWYSPEEIRPLINIWIDENWGAENCEIKTCILTSKESALGFLLVQKFWSERDFFGNIMIKDYLRNFLSCHLRRRFDDQPKRKIRRRGYNDKGTLRPKHISPIYDHSKFKSIYQVELERAENKRKYHYLVQEIEDRLLIEQVPV